MIWSMLFVDEKPISEITRRTKRKKGYWSAPLLDRWLGCGHVEHSAGGLAERHEVHGWRGLGLDARHTGRELERDGEQALHQT